MIDLTEHDHQTVGGLDARDAVIRLLTDPAGPLSDCAARIEDAPAAYMLGRLYRMATGGGILRGKPYYEGQELFAARVRSTARRALDPMGWMSRLAVALGLRWESLPESDRVWWRGRAADLTRSPDGVKLTTDWARIRQPDRLGDLITSAVIAAGWIKAIKEHRKESDDA